MKHRIKNYSISVNESFMNPISISHYFILFTNIKLIPISSYKQTSHFINKAPVHIHEMGI